MRELNGRILAAHNYDPAFRYSPPKADKNNIMPRFGIVWNPRTDHNGLLGLLAGGQKLVLRVGYALTYDASFININVGVFQSHPFVAVQNTSLTNAFTALVNTTVPTLVNPHLLSRTAVAKDFRSPAVDHISLDLQRELSGDYLIKVGYVRTRGTGLFQTIDGNPRLPCQFGTGAGMCNTTGIDRNSGAPLPGGLIPIVSARRDPAHGNIQIRGNAASSIYNALQSSLEKRWNCGLGFSVNYTWSAFIDTASEIFSDAQDSLGQDPYDLTADRARSRYDIPHGLKGNIVYELPFLRAQQGVAGKLMGGWQITSFFNFDSGVPFTVFNGSDPAGVQVLSPGAVRPNVYSALDLSRMSITQLFVLNQQQRSSAIAEAQRIFNSLPPGPCVPGWLPGPPLPVTLFSAPRGRIECNPHGSARTLVVEFNGVPEGQRVGNAGRNILRSDGMRAIDVGIIKNLRLGEQVRTRFWADVFNVFNTRNFGIPSGVASSPAFLNQWATDGGNRRIRIGARLVF